MQVNIERTQQQRAAGADDRLRHKLRIEQRHPEVSRRWIDFGPSAGVEHERRDAGYQHQTDPGRHRVYPTDGEMLLFGQTPPIVKEDEGGQQLDEEEDPLGGPTEDEGANQHLGGQRRAESDDPPDAHAGDGAEDDGQEDEKGGMAP